MLVLIQKIYCGPLRNVIPMLLCVGSEKLYSLNSVLVTGNGIYCNMLTVESFICVAVKPLVLSDQLTLCDLRT